MAIDSMDQIIAEIEEESRKAAAEAAEAKAKRAAGGGNGMIFILGDGKRALVRPLLNQFISVWRHDWYNQATKKTEIRAICTQTLGIPAEQCQHCVKAQQTGDKKLAAVRQWIIPVWLYAIKDVKTGDPLTYKDKEGVEHLSCGLRFIQAKGDDPILTFFKNMYKLSRDITIRDVSIEQIGERLEKKYEFDPKDIKPFDAAEIPEVSQDPDLIIARLAEINPPALIGGSTPAQSNSSSAPAKSAVPDF